MEPSALAMIFYALKNYYKHQVDYITSTTQTTLTSSPTFNAVNINASGYIRAASIYSNATVAASNM